MLICLLRYQELATNIDGEDLVECFHGNLVNFVKVLNAAIGVDDIDLAILFLRSFEQVFDVLWLRDVSFETYGTHTVRACCLGNVLCCVGRGVVLETSGYEPLDGGEEGSH